MFHSPCNGGKCLAIRVTSLLYLRRSNGSPSEFASHAMHAKVALSPHLDVYNRTGYKVGITDFNMAEQQTSKAGPSPSSGSVVSEAWTRTELARHPQRPYPMDFIQALFT